MPSAALLPPLESFRIHGVRLASELRLEAGTSPSQNGMRGLAGRSPVAPIAAFARRTTRQRNSVGERAGDGTEDMFAAATEALESVGTDRDGQ